MKIEEKNNIQQKFVDFSTKHGNLVKELGMARTDRGKDDGVGGDYGYAPARFETARLEFVAKEGLKDELNAKQTKGSRRVPRRCPFP